MIDILVTIIRIYQKLISPDHSFWGRRRFPHGFCRFYPSCSEYSRQAIVRHGLLKGIGKSIWRILRCNPFSVGGFDVVEKMGVKGGRG